MGIRLITDKRFCLNCNSKTTYVWRTYQNWYKYKDGFICKKCHNKLFKTPKWRYDKYNAIKNPKLLRWTPKHKQILLKQNPRKGICQQCGYAGETGLHHLQYHDDDPLKDTIELCKSCHAKAHPRTRDSRGRFVTTYS